MRWRSKLIHTQTAVPQGFHSLAAPTHRGSTVVFGSRAEASDDWRQGESGYTYGLYGTPTTLELGARVAELEGAYHTFVTPGGQAAITLIYFAFCSAGSHVLLPSTAYGPNAELADGILQRCGIRTELYDPLIGSGIADLIRPETSLIWCESPGSITMEVQDVPAIVASAHARSIPVALDNTYSAGVLFDAFSAGVDVSMQALTKYVGGHSDLLLGSVSARTQAVYLKLGDAQRQLGMGASPDDCSLALRGLKTLGVRMDALERSTLEVARWLAARPEIEAVLHPALPSCPGNAFWQRDFTGSASIFSVIFSARVSPSNVNAFVDALKLFKIGWSWGGVTSLAMSYPNLKRLQGDAAGRLVRFNIGLEDTRDLLDDLESALSVCPL
ncbi:MAG: cystathionine beta-lyase [Candidatus Velthaea sp.]|jgi:cystathionine beta-lyase